MARNRAKLLALGIPVGIMELQDLVKKENSTRLAAGDGGGGEPLLQLGEEGAAEPQETERRHRGGTREGEPQDEEGLTEEEIAARAEQLKAREAVRLRELELEGLVDYDPRVGDPLGGDPGGSAVFVVIGSTGNHYTVRLSDAKRSCQCMDCRVRKRDCKHIRLILGKLQAVERSFQSAPALGAQHAAGGAAGAVEPEAKAGAEGEERSAGAATADGGASAAAGDGDGAGAEAAGKLRSRAGKSGASGTGTGTKRLGAAGAEPTQQRTTRQRRR
ncbi:hypothetical protein GPECTOR_44g27 [Gonium pectorale]|uniref:SWIM-type domain-containing protein n=1 Tax=Gonium pectorale TaxID=33097 RepID=A0A150G943_GONPE|nr:hypothetical protein GPECTOR_44g27 [Gonium pectorale]|eukprot:KXZ46348.1 hypothetical protein GPECTOR_44g27 [Gonium pectorale]